MKRLSAWFACVFASLVFTVSNALALDVSSLTTVFDSAKTDIEAFVVVILGVLAVMWVARKFIKTTNRS